MTQVMPAPKLTHTDSRQFVILKKIGGVAMMGGCTGCGRKFFTPSTLFHDAFGADEYLRGKFDLHDCPPKKKTAEIARSRTGRNHE